MRMQLDEKAMLMPGNFAAYVRDGELYLPKDFVLGLPAADRRIDCAETLVSVLLTFPSTVVNVLGWSAQDVQNATKVLQVQLQGYLPAQFTDPNFKPEKRGYGAFPPV